MNTLKKRLAAKTLVGYNGQQMAHQPQPRFTGYDGTRDEFVDVGGITNGFASELNSDQTFNLSFNCTSANDTEVILFPSMYPTAGFLIAGDGAVGGGSTGFNPITFGGSPQPLKMFQEWIMRKPTRIVGMKLNSANQLQHDVDITLLPKTPWRAGTEPRTIPLSLHTNEFKNQLTITSIKAQFQLDDKTEMRIRLKGSTTGTITFLCGAVLDTAEALRTKAKASGVATA